MHNETSLENNSTDLMFDRVHNFTTYYYFAKLASKIFLENLSVFFLQTARDSHSGG